VKTTVAPAVRSHTGASMRTVVRVAALTVVLAFGGCGGDDDDDGGGGGGGSGNGEGEARSVVRAYFDQVVAGESEEACKAYLTKDGIRNIYGQANCEGVVDVVPGPVRIASVEGESVVVFLSEGTADERVVTLEDEGGALKIDSIERP
jgi:hypothetical protein